MICITWIFLSKLFQIEINAKCFHFSYTAFTYEQKSQPNTKLIFELFLFLMQEESTFRTYMIWRRKKSKIVLSMLYSVGLIPDAMTQCTLAYPLIMGDYLWMLLVEGEGELFLVPSCFFILL